MMMIFVKKRLHRIVIVKNTIIWGKHVCYPQNNLVNVKSKQKIKIYTAFVKDIIWG